MAKKYNAAFPSIVEDILQNSNFEGLSVATELGSNRLKELLEYAVPDCSPYRGYVVPLIFEKFVQAPTTIQMHHAYVLGWCFQMTQSFWGIADDIMDEGYYRWGKPSWHQLSVANKIAGVNDCILLEHAAYSLLRQHFIYDSNLHSDLVNILNEGTYKVALGQQVEALRGIDDVLTQKIIGLDCASGMRVYMESVQLKSGYSAVYIQFLLALRLAGLSRRDNEDLYKNMRKIALEIGVLGQLEDDFMDWAGPVESSEIYSDIMNKKSTWCYQQARRLCKGQPKEENILLQNYGRADKHCVEAVVALYKKLNLEKILRDYERKISDGIQTSVKAVEERYNIRGLSESISSYTKILLNFSKPGNDEIIFDYPPCPQ